MFGRFTPKLAYGCGCGGSGGGSGSNQVGPAAPGYTSTKREAPRWDGPGRRRATTPPTAPKKPGT